SSTSVLHGSQGLLDRVQRLPIDEDHPVWPTGSYALSKLLGERMLENFAAATGLQAVSLRLEWIWFQHSPVGIEMDNPPLGVEATGRGDVFPFEYWQYVDARDAASACRLAAEDTSPGRAEALFVATDRTTVEPHAELVERFHPRLAGGLAGGALAVSIDRSRERLGYVPAHSWRGVEAMESA